MTTDTAASLLRAILDDPDDDVVRLVYADHLEDQGETERAEFIRVQILLAQLSFRFPCRACNKLLESDRIADGCPCNSPRGVNHGLAPVYVCTCLECDPAQTGSVRERPADVESLYRRERSLLHDSNFNLWDAFASWGASDWTMTTHAHEIAFRVGIKEGTHDVWCYLRRGLVDEVVCSLDDWLTHGAAILAAHPVREVRSTTPVFRPEHWDYLDSDLCIVYLKPQGPDYDLDEIGVRVGDNIGEAIIRRRWPGVTFEFPPEGNQ